MYILVIQIIPKTQGVRKETHCKSGIVIALNGKPWLDVKNMSVASRSLLHKIVNFFG